MWAQGGEDNNPDSPDNPNVYYKLILDASPRSGGSVYSYSGNQLSFGNYCEVYAASRLGYEFKYWKDADSVVVSENPYYWFSMPDHDVTLTAYFEYNPVYNPINPPDPDAQGYSHKVKIECVPSGGGDYYAPNTLVEGETDYIYAYPRGGYQFVAWTLKDGTVISTDNPLNIKMGLADVTYCAKFEYNPISPGDPSPNLFDQQTGEMLIDNFRPGYLYEAIYSLVDWDNFSSVQSITIVGKMSMKDCGFGYELKKCTLIDLSRTSGYNIIPNRAFELSKELSKIILPSSVEHIGDWAFYGCSNLTELICYAPTPPSLRDSTFHEVDGLVVRVPAASLALYQGAEGWEDYTVLPLDEETCNLTVNLPEDANDGRYKSLYIEMQNAASGQKYKYLITDRTSYTFSNLIYNTTYHIYVKNAAGVELGKKENVALGSEDLTVTFDNLKQQRPISAKVLTPNGTDVTAQTSVAWYYADGNLISESASVSVLEGTNVKYRITLPSALATLYIIPSDSSLTVQSAGNEVVCPLQAFQQVTLTGKILDLTTDQAVAGATVTVSQELNGKYSKSTTVLCGKDGSFSTTVFNVPSTVTFSAANYISKTTEYDSFTNTQLGNITLKAITGAVISLKYTYTESVEEGGTAQAQDGYSDNANIAYSLYNQTQDKPIIEYNLQNSGIVLMEEVAEGDVISLTASSRKGLFKDVTATATIDDKNRAEATINIVALGGIKASFVENANKKVVGILYNSNGVLLSKSQFVDKAISISDLPDGSYSLVTMGSSKFFNSVLNISELAKAGLSEGKDYVKNTVTVKSGTIRKIEISSVPTFDESQFYKTGPNTSFTANKMSVQVGNYLTLTGRLDFLPEVNTDSLKNVELIVDLPQNCSYVDGSVIIGNTTSTATLNGNQVTIPLADYSEMVRFCVIPTLGGTYTPNAFVHYELFGDTITQPIGSAYYVAKDLSISVPAVVAKPKIPVSGTATAKSTIDIYDNGVMIGQTTSLANGSWATTCELYDTTNLSQHQIYAKVTTKTGVKMQSETKIVTYDVDAISVSNVTMYYTNPEVNGWRGQNYVLPYNFENPSTTPNKYIYYIYDTHFNFTIEFNTNDTTKIKDVILNVKTGDGNWVALNTTYDKRTGKWMASGEFGDMYDGIVPVNFSVIYRIDVIKTEQHSGCPDANVAIDPSGYVYEGVSSNRLQGVKATIYYMASTEDANGVMHNEPKIWDAEEFEQENPLFTDEDGMYKWDVPQGQWQVKFEKDGYETAYSEWLPVPPPQLDINVGMTQTVQPEVKLVRAYKDGIEIEFDKYMQPATLNTSNILVTEGGQAVQGEMVMLNQEKANENSGLKFASKVRFVPNAPITANKITLTVNKQVMSYAGLQMSDDYQQEFDIEHEITEIKADSAIKVAYGSGQKIIITALPGVASAGKTLRISNSSAMIVSLMSDTCVLDNEGKASFTITGQLPGSATLTFKIDGYDITAKTIVNIEMKEMETCATPTVSIESGSTVDEGTGIQLLCTTEGATIYYTLDGTNPHGNTQSVIEYDGNPIIINDTVVIKAIAIAPDMYESELGEFKFNVRLLETCKKPASSVASGTAVDKGTTIQLSCETQGATIYYTLDGSDPSVSATRIAYDGTPIVINDTVTIKAISIAPKMHNSVVVIFEYTVKAGGGSGESGNPTGVGSISANKNSIKIYPQPLNDELNVSVEGKTIRNVSITAMTGVTVISQDANSNEVSLNVSSLDSGIYIIVIQTDQGKYTYKIVKSK